MRKFVSFLRGVVGSPVTHLTTPVVVLPDEEFLVAMNHKISRKKNTNMFMMVFSAMYAKLIVVLGIAFSLSPIISAHTPNDAFRAFFLYLYFVSIIFLIYAFIVHMAVPAWLESLIKRLSILKRNFKSQSNNNNIENKDDSYTDNNSDKMSMGYAIDSRNCGSFYLRVGAVAFGIGSMIRSGLEVITFLERKSSSECQDYMLLISPSSHLIFTFLQLYFIFINSRMSFHHHESIGHMGLMHLLATNLCVWLISVVEETQHEIFHKQDHIKAIQIHVSNSLRHAHEGDYVPDDFVKQDFVDDDYVEDDFVISNTIAIPAPTQHGHVMHVDNGTSCQRTDVFSRLLGDISPFLFPCIIEYSLICAAICYIMWKHAGQKRIRHNSDSVMEIPIRRHMYSVDCSHAITGLFTGIMVLVLSIISVIIFFVLVSKENHLLVAIRVGYVSELILFVLNILAVILAMVKIKHFRRIRHRSNVELDNILLIIGQMGVYMLSIFSLIAAHLSGRIGVLNIYMMLSSLGRLVQATLQTMFILDASSRGASSEEQERRKPGREMVTFLLVCNFAMWIITTLETGRMESGILQLGYFGFWGWTLIARISTPLSIFYRFHSTVCLCDIWKKLYKFKGDNV